jgi:hypothetical protein
MEKDHATAFAGLLKDKQQVPAFQKSMKHRY